MQLDFPNEIGCMQQYYLYRGNVVGVSYTKGYFIYDREVKEAQHFNNSANWIEELKYRDLGPLPTNDYGKLTGIMNRKPVLELLDYDRTTNCFAVDRFIVGEGERYRYFIFNEKSRESVQFTSREKWNREVAARNLTPLVTRWHQGSWNFRMVSDVVNLALQHVKVTLVALAGLVFLHLLLVLKVLGSRSQRFKLSVLCLTTLEVAGLVYFITVNLPYSF